MKVSIIVPVYNTREYLDKCLQSLVNQTLKEIEIIVINDGSKQEVDDIIAKYKDQIIYVNNNNHGIGYTRNLGIKMAKGEYIGFVDSDDYVNEDMYLDYYNYAKDNDLDLVVANYTRFSSTSQKLEAIKHFDIGNIYNNKNILINIDFGPCNKIFKKEILINNNISFEENLKYEDMPFVFKFLKHAIKIGHIDKAYYNYNVRESSETTTLNERDFDIFSILNIINDYFKEDKTITKELEYINVSKLLDYNILQRTQKNSKMRNDFINKSFKYIKDIFPNYKKNEYLKRENIIKKMIKQNKIITKLYCFIYPKRAKI